MILSFCYYNHSKNPDRTIPLAFHLEQTLKELPMTKSKTKSQVIDRITDIDKHDIITTDEDIIDAVIVSETGIVRNKKGVFQKGTKNPREALKQVKIKELKEIIERKTGKSCERIIQKLAMIALYDPDEKVLVKDESSGEYETKKRRYHFYNATTQMQAITLLLAYVYGRPTEKTETETQVDVRIEKTVADITSLIEQNKERIRLVK